jgi:hypothetical protein
MALNPNIALGVRPLEIANPLAQYGQIAQIQNAQNQNAMAQIQMREAEAAAQEKNMLRRLDPTAADYESQLFRVSPQLGINYRKEKAAAEASKAATASSLATAAKAKQQLLGQALRDISGRPSDANITAHTEDIQASPLFSPEEKARALVTQQTLLSIPFDQRQAYLAAQGASASELKPTLTSQDFGGGKRVIATPAFGGAATLVPGSEITKTPTFADITSQGQLKVSQGQLGVSQGQLNLARDRLAQENQGVTYQQDAQGNFVALPSRLPSGVMPVARPVTGEGGAPVKGKPSAFAEKTAAQRAQTNRDLGFAITQLSEVTKDGGLIDQSTGSGAGRLADIGAGFVGKATPGAIAIGKIAPIADLVLKMVPRFEGPQSNKDTQSYKEAAGQLADPTLPTAIRKEAGKTVLRLMQERKNQFVTNDMAAEGAAPTQIAPPAGFTPDQ